MNMKTERQQRRVSWLARTRMSLATRWRPRTWVIAALVALVVLASPGSPLSQFVGIGGIARAATVRKSGQPHRTNPADGTKSVTHLPPTPQSVKPSTTPHTIARLGKMPMKPGSLALSPTSPTTFTGSDGVFEIDVPAGAITAADLAAAGGAISMKITQIAPSSGSSAGGSGVISFGSYLVRLVDAHGNPLSHGLRLAATLKLHYGAGDGALNLDHAFIVFNGSLPKNAPVGPTGIGHYLTENTTHDRTHQTLVGTLPADPALAAPGGAKVDAMPAASQQYPPTALTWDTYTYVPAFGKPDPFTVDLAGGTLTEGTQIDVPSGPGGTLPNITLAYNSGSVSELHSPQAAANWVGEGWNLGLGEISWSEHNVLANTQNPKWQDSWQLVDPFGTSAELIPPAINVSTYYDNTPNGITPSPVQWHTASESYDKIYSYVGPNSIGMPANPPCFRVFLPNGIMEEFGCTPDSLQYYYVPGSGDYIANWYLDLITNMQGNQVHLGYQSDMQSITYNGTQYNYPRDTHLYVVEWDSPTCFSQPQVACATNGSASNGTLWAPLDEVVFNAGHSPTRLTNSPSGCNTGSNYRCDDPVDLSGSGGIAAPEEQSTFVLNDIAVETRTCSSGINCATWNQLRDYQLSYEQSGPTTITDPVTGKQVSAAGMLDLTAIQQVGDDGTTAYPATTYGYGSETEYYEDGTFYPYSTGFCGPTWNRGGNGGSCDLWGQTYDGNSRYITSASNGQGLAQAFTWADARNNTHGSAQPANPLYCDANQTGYPCDEADDQAWSRIVLGEQDNTVLQVTQAGQNGQQTTTPVTSKYVYTYQLTYPLVAQECGDCVAGMYWGNQNDGDFLDYYNSHFMGFAQASVSNPDGSLETHKFYATEGFGVFDTTQITSCPSNLPPVNTACHNSPWWNLGNAAHGNEYEADYYDTNGTTLLKKVTTSYQAICPPSGVSGSPPVNGITWDGHLVSEVDNDNPVAVCDVQETQSATTTFDGGTSSVSDTESYAYDSYGRVTQTTSASNSGTPATILHKTSYVWDDAVSATSGGATGVYLIDYPAFQDTEDTSANRYTCQYTSYDGASYATGQTSSLLWGDVTEDDTYTSCGSAPNYTPSGLVGSSAKIDSYGNLLGTKDPDANANVSGHTGCIVSGVQYTSCKNYDPVTHALETGDTNVKNQSTTTGYSSTSDPSGGYGLWPISSTDPNSQATSVHYDALGRMTSTIEPGDSSTNPTMKMAYANWCAGTAAQTPCVEQDSAQQLVTNSGAYVTTRTFYDGMGRVVETRSPATSGSDIVTFTLYGANGYPTSSVRYFVAAYTGAAGQAAFSIPDSTVAESTSTADGLGRQTSATDALSNTTHTSYSVNCAAVSGDSACYEETATIDANGHQTASFTDGFGRAIYTQSFTGAGPYTLYASTKNTYDYQGHVATTTYPNGTSQATYTYDDAGRLTASSDPDLGSYTYTYDANGNLLGKIFTASSAYTVYYTYDGLNRKLTEGPNANGSGWLASWTYDCAPLNSCPSGNYGLGRETGESFVSNNATGGYAYVYDQRGQATGWTMNLGSGSFPFTYAYNDAGMQTSVHYANGDTLATSYTNQGLPGGVTLTSGSTNTTLVGSIVYGPNGPTSASVGNGEYTWSLGYDTLGRTTSTQAAITGGGTLFAQSHTYDAAGNVSTVNTSLPAGTDNQAYCYDEQNRLTWAGSTGTAPCQSFTPGTLTAADYTQIYAYDTLNRLTTGPLGAGYTYGDASHLDAVTSAPGFATSYDEAGDMQTTGPATLLTYDELRRMTMWEHFVSKYDIVQEQNSYDGEDNLVQQVMSEKGKVTNDTVYVGSYEQTTLTLDTSYYNAGLVTVTKQNGTLAYVVADGLGSVTAALSSTGTVTAAALYAPYGQGRYSSGTMPSDGGYAGQVVDPSGLSYDHARYYDASVGQFISADDVQGPNRYGYVAGNPTTMTDPSGNIGICVGAVADGVCHHGGSGSNGGGTPPRHHPPHHHHPYRYPPTTRSFSPLTKCTEHVACLGNIDLLPGPGIPTPPEMNVGIVFVDDPFFGLPIIPDYFWIQANQPWWDYATLFPAAAAVVIEAALALENFPSIFDGLIDTGLSLRRKSW